MGEYNPREFINIIKYNKKAIYELNLHDSKFNEEELDLLCDALKYNKTIKLLNLSNNNISLTALKSLSKNKTIKSLNISDCNICDNGCIYISKLIEDNNTLNTIMMTGNMITDLGCKSLCDSLKYNKNIITFNIAFNKLRTDGLLHFYHLLKINNTLQDVSYMNNILRRLWTFFQILLITKNIYPVN
jgi:Ran GTPase-activating protein (RanGAP) involved in mRNA processing and transport